MRRVGTRGVELSPDILEAQRLSELAGNVTLQLEELGDDLAIAALRIESAVDVVTGFALDGSPNQLVLTPLPLSSGAPPEPIRTPVPLPPQPEPDLASPPPAEPLWHAPPDTPWNLVRQESSHNSYLNAGGIGVLYHHGVRSFEFDIHRGAPTDFTPWTDPLALASPLLAIAYDHARHDRGVTNDWRGYHLSGSARSEYDLLSDGLQAVADLASAEPITVFIDVKDDFAGSHTAEAFDRLLRDRLGEDLYTPGDLIARLPEADNLEQVIAEVGWPTVAELDGRVLVVLTGNFDQYQSTSPAAFVAPAPRFVTTDDGPQHLPTPGVVFYNAEFSTDDDDAIRNIRSRGLIVRTYFNPPCNAPFAEDLLRAENYRAIDFDFAPGPRCSSGPPPTRTRAVPVDG